MTLFLMLASEMMRMVFGFEELSRILSSEQRCAFMTSVSLQFTVWKEKQLGKLSTKRNPGDSSLLKEGWTSFKWLLVSMIELLILRRCFSVRLPIERRWGLAFLKWWLSKSELIACCLATPRWCLPLTLSRWRWMGMKPAMASTPSWLLVACDRSQNDWS